VPRVREPEERVFAASCLENCLRQMISIAAAGTVCRPALPDRAASGLLARWLCVADGVPSSGGGSRPLPRGSSLLTVTDELSRTSQQQCWRATGRVPPKRSSSAPLATGA